MSAKAKKIGVRIIQIWVKFEVELAQDSKHK